MILDSELRWFHSILPWKSLAHSWATMATDGPDTIHLSVHWHAESGFVVWGVVTTVSDEVYPTCTHVLVPLLSTAWRVSLWECDISLWKKYKGHLSVPQSFTHMHSIKRSVLFLWITTDREILHAQALISYFKFLFSFLLPQIKAAFGPLTVERVCLRTIDACYERWFLNAVSVTGLHF